MASLMAAIAVAYYLSKKKTASDVKSEESINEKGCFKAFSRNNSEVVDSFTRV